MIELNKENFESEVLNTDRVVVVDFWSESCDRCLELMPDIETMAEKYGDQARFAKLDIKGNRRLAMSQQVLGLPSIVIYNDGQKVEHLSGEDLEAEEVEQAIKEHI